MKNLIHNITLFSFLFLGLLPLGQAQDEPYLQLLTEGHQKYNEENYLGAVLAYSGSIYQKGNNPEAYFWRGLAKWNLGRYLNAAYDLQSAINSGCADKGTAYFWMGDAYYKVEKYELAHAAFLLSLNYTCPYPDSARKFMSEIQQKYLNVSLSASEYVQKGHDLYSEENYQKAIENYNSAISKEAQNEEAYFWRAMAKWNVKNFHGAANDLNMAIRSGYRDKGVAYYWKGRAEYENEKYQEAVKDFNSAMENKYPQLVHLYLWRGYTHWNLNNYNQVVSDLTQAMKLDHPDKGDIYYWIADVQYKRRDFQAAIENYQKSLDLTCPYPDTAKQRIEEIYEQHIGGGIEIAWKNLPQQHTTTKQEFFDIKICVEADLDLATAFLYVNNEKSTISVGVNRLLAVGKNCSNPISKNIKLRKGINQIKLVLTDERGNSKTENRQILYKTNQLVQNKAKVWAVIVGVASYNHISSLRYSDDDAYQMFAFLKSPEGGALQDNQISILIDENATRANILKTMREKFSQAGANDLVLFYYSGHGAEGAFIPFDYDGSAGSKLSHSDIQAIFRSSKAKNKLCIADACHSGSLNRGARSASILEVTSNYYQALVDSEGGMALMMSSKAEETSIEFQGLRQGVFSHYLIRGLKGEADRNQDKIVTVEELYQFARKETQSYTNHKQNPELHGDFDRKMPVAAVR